MSLALCRSEFVLGGQRSGKSRRAEDLARLWLGTNPAHRAVFVATAQPWDAEMAARIARHQQDRAKRLPGMLTLEEPLALGSAITQHSRADTLVVVDCLTLWLTNLLMPLEPDANDLPRHQLHPVADKAQANTHGQDMRGQEDSFLASIGAAAGPLVLVSNEIGLGVIPMGAQVRAYVDALGRLNQQVAQRCQRVTLMAAGLPLTLKDELKDSPP